MSANKRFDEKIYTSWTENYLSGATIRAISNEYGVSDPTVIYHLKKRGIKRRSNSECQLANPTASNMDLSYDQKQVIIGSVVGDGTVRKQSELSFLQLAHSIQQIEWLEYKIHKLGELSSNKGMIIRNGTNRKTNSNKICEYRTVPHGFINELHSLSYKENKKRKIDELIPMIDPLALAIIWGDDGSFGRTNGHPYGILATCAYDMDDVKLFSEMLMSKYNIKSSHLVKKSCGKLYTQLRVSKAGMINLSDIINTYLPSSMKYKIGG